MIKYVDAFAGVGGFHRGIESAASAIGLRAECAMAIEWDPDCQAYYEKNYGVAPVGDITKLDEKEVPDHDLLTGGFPCQPFSRNGKFYNKNAKTLGDDDRANLFLELVRILREKQPKFFIFENVKGLLSMKNADGSDCLETIVENLRGCGYSVSWQVVNTACFGLPQQRERVYFVGIREDLAVRPFLFPGQVPNSRICVADVLEPLVNDKYLLKNLWAKRKINLNHAPANAHKVNHPFPKGHDRFEVLQWLYEQASKPTSPTGEIESVAILYGDTPSGLPRQQDKIYSVLGISPTIATFSTPCFDTPQGIRQLTPRECFRLQGFPDTHIIPTKDSVAYKQAGNAVSVVTVKALVTQLLLSKFKSEPVAA